MDLIDYNDYVNHDGHYDWESSHKFYLELSELCMRNKCMIVTHQSSWKGKKGNKYEPSFITREEFNETVKKVDDCNNMISIKVIKNRTDVPNIKVHRIF